MGDLTSILDNHPDIRDWIVQEVRESRDEAYLIQDGQGGVDTERLSHAVDSYTSVTVYCGHDEKLGSSSVKLTANEPVEAQINDLVAKARTVANQDWTLPEPREFEPVVASDEYLTELPEECIADLIHEVKTTIPGDVEFNNTEIFVTSTETATRTSKGFEGKQRSSQIYFEVALSHTNLEGKSDEVLRHTEATSFDELDVRRIMQDAAEDAKNITEVRRPEAGQYEVIVRKDVISQLFHSLISKADGYNEYANMPHLKIGDKLVEVPLGDKVTLTVDPTLPMGAESTAYDATGQLCERIELIVDNEVKAQLLGKKYADYLRREPNGGEGNIVMEPGSISYEEMQRHSGKVIEIIEFSALFCDSLAGTFSSEIRLAKVYDGDEAYYVKGGSLAGNMAQALTHAYFSKETAKHTGKGGYVGPAYMLFEATVSSTA